MAARWAGIKTLVATRRDAGHFRSGLIGRLEVAAAAWCDAVVCVSEAIRQQAIAKEAIPVVKTRVIYNGVDCGVFRRGEHDEQGSFLSVAMVATMDRKTKGHVYFLEAAATILGKRNDVRFILFGDGPLRPFFERMVRSKNLQNSISFRGKTGRLHEALSDIDVLVVPSESEGCSNALLEAMAMGIPAVATAVEGNLEVVRDSIDGLLVEPKTARDIAEKIELLLNDDERRRRMGQAARRSVEERFSLETMVRGYLELYQELTAIARVGYVVSLFPCWSETFVLNEIIELEKRGLHVSIFSIRRDIEELIHDEALPLMRKTVYATAFRGILSTFRWLLRRPFALSSLFWMAVRQKYSDPQVLFKNIYAITVGCHFASLAIRKRIQHLHAHFATYPTLAAMTASRLTGIPYSFTAHAHDIFLEKTLLKEKVAHAKAVVAISRYNKDYIEDYCGNGAVSNVRVIHCGVDAGEICANVPSKAHEEKLILSVGRLCRMKGFEYLIQACGRLKKDLRFRCLIVGEGPLRASLEVMIDDLGLREYVILKGALEHTDLMALLVRASLFVLPSVWSDKDGQEGIPVVLMEAMALGVPVVASRLSGIPELVREGETGLLATPGDEYDLTRKIMAMDSDPALRDRMVQNGRGLVEREFNIKKSCDALLEEVFTLS